MAPTDLAGLFNAAFKMAIAVGGILAVIRLVYAGAVYMTTDLPGAKGNAKTIIGEAMTGLLLLLAVWLILYQINPQILNLNILANLPNAPPTMVSPPTVLVTPNNPNTPDGTACLISINGERHPGVFQGGICRFAPVVHGPPSQPPPAAAVMYCYTRPWPFTGTFCYDTYSACFIWGANSCGARGSH